MSRSSKGSSSYASTQERHWQLTTNFQQSMMAEVIRTRREETPSSGVDLLHSLPLEIQNMIYELAILGDRPTEDLGYRINLPFKKKALSKTRSGRSIRHQSETAACFSQSKARAAVAWTCRRAYELHGTKWYAGTKFIFRNKEHMNNFRTAIGERNCKAIRRIIWDYSWNDVKVDNIMLPTHVQLNFPCIQQFTMQMKSKREDTEDWAAYLDIIRNIMERYEQIQDLTVLGKSEWDHDNIHSPAFSFAVQATRELGTKGLRVAFQFRTSCPPETKHFKSLIYNEGRWRIDD